MAFAKTTFATLAAIAALPVCGALMNSGLRGSTQLEGSKQLERPEGKFTEVDFLLQEYVRLHQWGRFDPSNGFVLATYGCPKQFGNRMHEFLNAFATAVITNRNLVWQYTRQAEGEHAVGTLDECEEVVHRKDWILNDNVLRHLNYTTTMVSSVSELACLGADAKIEGQELIQHGTWEQYQASILLESGAKLSEEAKLRAQVLFSSGVEVAYGKLWDAAFAFDSERIVGPSFKALQEQRLVDDAGVRVHQDSLWVAVHVRHKTTNLTSAERRWEASTNWDEATKLLEGKHGNCAVLLATDDEETEGIMKPWVAQKGCSLVRSRYDVVEASFRDEHGLHAGVGAIRDLYLLSLADVFVGTTWSSFTQSIAERILSRRPNSKWSICGKYSCTTNSTEGFPFNNKLESSCEAGI